MRHGSLFSGIGGFDLAAQWMGWENVFHCEWNPFGRTILKHYWPNSISYENIVTTDFTVHRGTIDILTGGFPCQPYSTAGKRLGKEDERHLWPEMLRAIREVSPRWVVGENVRGLTNWNGGMVFDEVQADLEAEGYEVLPFLLPACAVNAPHRRDRIWFIAHAGHTELQGRDESQEGQQPNRRRDARSEPAPHGGLRVSPNTNGTPTEYPIQAGWDMLASVHEQIAADAFSFGQSGQGWTFNTGSTTPYGDWKASWAYDDGRWPTQPPVCTGNDGFPKRLDTSTISLKDWREESLKSAGNAIVPQVAFQIFKAIEQYENLNP